MSEFVFSASEVFPIYARGLVFRGKVVSGVAREGDVLEIQTSNGIERGIISFIGLNRQGIGITIKDTEINILLKDFDSGVANRSFLDLPETEEQAENHPSIESTLKFELPVTLTKGQK